MISIFYFVALRLFQQMPVRKIIKTKTLLSAIFDFIFFSPFSSDTQSHTKSVKMK